MKYSDWLLVLFLFAPLTHAQSVPPDACSNSAFGAIAAFENYVDPKINTDAEFIETRCSRQGKDSYRMELVANCNDTDPSTTNTIDIKITSKESFQGCATAPNRNAKCNEHIPLTSDSISLSNQELAAWVIELRSICDLYVYTPPAAQ